MSDIFCSIRAAMRYRGYAPQPVTFLGTLKWLRQFNRADRRPIERLLGGVFYFSEERVKDILVEQNERLMTRLASAELRENQLIYVQVHDAGSSSGVMLNMVRDLCRLQQRGCHFLDSRDSLGLNERTNQLSEGALIYVDDFVGSGTQLCEARDFAVKNIVGNFSEFLLVPCICEEGMETLDQRGIETFAGHVHRKAERPLHGDSTEFDQTTKERLISLCEEIDPKMPLGFGHLAAMTVLYRNAPDNVPMLFRGSANQDPKVGIFPRTTDLPH